MDALPPSLASDIADLRTRITNLERSNKLLVSSIVGGTLRILDASQNPVALLGLLPDSTLGVRVYSSGGVGVSPMLSANQTDGFAFPWFSTEWKTPTDSVVVTSGTFATQWTSTTELIFSKEVLFRVRFVVDAATTGEARVLWTNIDGSSPIQLGSTLSLSASTDAVHEYRFPHTVTLGTGPVMLSVQTRRVTGAGNVTVYHPHPLHYGAIGAVAGGWV